MPRQLSSGLPRLALILASLGLFPRPAAAFIIIHAATSGNTPLAVSIILIVLFIILVGILFYRYNQRRVRAALDAEGGPGMLPPGQQPAWVTEGGGGAASVNVNVNAPQNYSQAPAWGPAARTQNSTAGAQFPVPMYASLGPAPVGAVQAPQPVYNNRSG